MTGTTQPLATIATFEKLVWTWQGQTLLPSALPFENAFSKRVR
ncbi:hypothetical protein [Dendronalium sp. ChiSLP03b]|nr:hypothetical protein [Dendronalium sp. ChiSLP03b]